MSYKPPANPLTDAEKKDVVDQYEGVRSRSQQAYDESVRTIAAGAVAVTASLTAAFGESGWSGGMAVAFSVASLFANLVSFETAQRHAKIVIDRAWGGDRVGIHAGSRWDWWTGFFNWAAFFLLLAAGLCLVVFVSSAA